MCEQMFDDLTHLRYANFSKQIPFADTIPLVSDGEPSLKPILRNFRDPEENRTSSRNENSPLEPIHGLRPWLYGSRINWRVFGTENVS